MLANVFSNTTPPRVEKDEGVPLLGLPDASRKSESVRVRGGKKARFCCAYSLLRVLHSPDTSRDIVHLSWICINS
jgi:hypothetical protein